MYLNFEDDRPEPPRVGSAISIREGVLVSLVAHLLFVIALLLAPRAFFQATPVEVAPVQPQQTIRFVEMAPRVDRTAPPIRPADPSDLDRRSTTRERPPDATNPTPYSRGNTPENKEGGRSERAAGDPAPSTTPAPPSEAPPPELTAKLAPDPSAKTRPAGGSLGQALRNLQQYLQTDNLENQRGGATDQSADFQFDSMGVDFGPWLKRFKALIERNWLVPEAAMFQKGHVVLQFNVLRNGTIINRRVAQSSSVEAFTTSAVNALILSNPAPALPPEYPADQVFFTVSFHYNEDIRNAP